MTPRSSNVPLPGIAAHWLVRLGAVFANWQASLMQSLGATRVHVLAPEYLLISFGEPVSLADCATESPEAAAAYALLRWILPVHHNWPTPISRTDQFIEKAAQALAVKFASAKPQNAFVTAARQDIALRRLGSNLRGRLLQVLNPESNGSSAPAESQDPALPSLWTFLHAKGLIAGIASPRTTKSLYPGGTRYVSQQGNETVSRAGAKLVEGLGFIGLAEPALNMPVPGTHWLELGAAPGGMTSELLAKGFCVTAVDRAPLATRLSSALGLTFVKADVAAFHPATQNKFNALLCDMNGPWQPAFKQVTRLASTLVPGAPVLFTLKFADLNNPSDVAAALKTLSHRANACGLAVRFVTHSTYNRLELSVVLGAS